MKRGICLRCLVLAAGAGVWAVPMARGATYYVDVTCGNDNWSGTSPECEPDNGPKATIQAGINASASGDVVIVAGGTYTGTDNKNLNFGARVITLKCAEGALCTVDCQDSDNFATFSSSNGANVIVEGFTITGGAGNDYYARGGAILCVDGSQPTIRDCVLRNNNGGDAGGGIALINGAYPTIDSCIIRNNQAKYGGGVYIEKGISNYAYGEIRDTIIGPGNSAWEGGGLYLDGATNPIDDPVTIKRCTIVRNRSSNLQGNGSGGGIQIRGDAAEPVIVNCVVVGNEVAGNSAGGGMQISGHQNPIERQSPLLVNTLFAGNTAKFGGGIHLYLHITPRIVDCHIVGNHAADYQGPGVGGGVCWEPTPGLARVVPCHDLIVWGNYAPVGRQLFEGVYGKLDVQYSDVKGGWAGTGNISGDPMFVGGPSGRWTSNADYNPDTATTTLYDSNAELPEGELLGKLLNPDTDQYLQSVIVANTDTTITVWGNFEGVGTSWRPYQINDYHLTDTSPCIDAASNPLVPEDETDLDEDGNTTEKTPRDIVMGPRHLDAEDVDDCWQAPGTCGDPPVVDMGAYEFAGQIDDDNCYPPPGCACDRCPATASAR